jgi:hypothetical protein
MNKHKRKKRSRVTNLRVRGVFCFVLNVSGELPAVLLILDEISHEVEGDDATEIAVVFIQKID